MKNGFVALHEDFESIFDDIKVAKIGRIKNIGDISILNDDFFISDAKVEQFDESIKELDPENGFNQIKKYKKDGINIGGFDESSAEFSAIEGSMYNTAYSYVHLTEDEWISGNWLSNHFITRSKLITENSEKLKYHDDPNSLYREIYAKERSSFLLRAVPNNTILFIDGPLLGGQINHYTLDLISKLHKKQIFPFFFVKNSNSNMVTENIEGLEAKYNSDVHWATEALKIRQSSPWYHYADKKNDKNQKLFCYFKSFDDVSPQRIEVHPQTFHYLESEISRVLDIIIYLMYENGNKRNPQIRPIAIAEMYARETRKFTNVQKRIRESGLIPTMNEERGFN